MSDTEWSTSSGLWRKTTSDSEELIDQACRVLAERYTVAQQVNPKFDRKKERAYWAAGGEGDDPTNPYLIDRPMAERVQDGCMTTFTAADGYLSIRTLSFREVAEALHSAGMLRPANTEVPSE
jgi:hypothetical protein